MLINNKRDIATINAGVEGGIGLQYPFGGRNIFVEFRTIIGFTNINVNAESHAKSETSSLAFAIGYCIKIK